MKSISIPACLLALLSLPTLAAAQQTPIRAANAVRSFNSAWIQEAQARPQLEGSGLRQEDDQPSPSDALVQEPAPIKWPTKDIRETVLDIRVGDERVPDDRSMELAGQWQEMPRMTSDKVFAWMAPDIRYQPLYFEDVALERYGQTFPPVRQAFASGAHFFKSTALLPLQMWHDHPYDCDHPLGFCRPGNPTPCIHQRQYFGLFRQ